MLDSNDGGRVRIRLRGTRGHGCEPSVPSTEPSGSKNAARRGMVAFVDGARA